ncbi:hypothetical protein FKW77_010271 [Venturia effusa]|uniref:Uncharacterized protein n=1 Tax=Venturia effusa TaxID=50376 RepID=A0A517L4I8_9PEZI|nr:hypothetical protein FKW77_010271 [Venturia effusa]
MARNAKEATSGMSSPTKETKGAPANFLALPLELRQEILYKSFEDVYKQDIHFSTNVNMLDGVLEIRRAPVCFLPHVHRHASILALVHNTISDDLDFVLKQILAAFESGLDEEWQRGACSEKRDRWTVLATEVEAAVCPDEDADISHHRRFQMVQDMREALGADMSQFSFDEDRPDSIRLSRH